MSASGYKTSPLSDELERRIRDEIRLYKSNPDGDDLRVKAYAAALEWVLSEAEMIKQEVRSTQFSNPCPDCGHEHLDEKRCSFPYAQDRECMCERKVSA